MDPVRASYDTIAGRYAQEIGGELAGKPVDRALYALFAELVGAGTVGDVGCGPGHVTAHLAGLGVRTVGVDLSPGMVAVARARYPESSSRASSPNMIAISGTNVSSMPTPATRPSRTSPSPCFPENRK